MTDAAGAFAFSAPKSGSYSLIAKKSGLCDRARSWLRLRRDKADILSSRGFGRVFCGASEFRRFSHSDNGICR